MVKGALLRMRSAGQMDSFVGIESLVEQLKSDGREDISLEAVERVLFKMESANQLMYRDHIIIFL